MISLRQKTYYLSLASGEVMLGALVVAMVAAHVNGRIDRLVDAELLLGRVDDWRAYIASGLSSKEVII